MGDELIRRRLEGLRLRGADPAPSWPRQRFKVINGGAIPTAVPRVFWGVPVGPVIGASTPAEGGSIASAVPADSEAQPIVVIGPEAPVAGRELLAHRINDQWVAEYGGEGPADEGPTVLVCGKCRIPTSKQLYATFSPGDNKPFWISYGTYPLTYQAIGEVCPSFPDFPWPPGWYFKDSYVIIGFFSCGMVSSGGFLCVGASGPNTVVSCDPILISIGGILLSCVIHE